ncbi:MAG: carboxypeptidase regulatory-like domain-containing protein [Candidatus Hydrogenedentes bacterium]|nr:carboxypeptidase regulatory-like domain-containing protein [Candidatus Hydrogenedentota bacterium]
MSATRVMFGALALMAYSALIAAEPAPSQWQEIELSLSGPADVQAISDLGLIIDDVAAGHVTAYARPEHLEALHKLGIAYTVVVEAGAPKDFSGYHDYVALTAELEQYAAEFASITRLISLGQSVEGRELWALLITGNPGEEEDEPEFKYVATMHGDEPVGTENCLRLIDYLLRGHGTDNRATALVESTAIWFVPHMNPDGNSNGSRSNAHDVDLNRDFPAYPTDFTQNYFDGGAISLEGREPEVQHVMAWALANSFVLSANTHTGSLVVNYPYDDDGVPSGVPAPTPDEELFQYLSLQYAMFNPPMYNSPEFENGITNGAAWYTISGGMQDWNYRFVSCFEVTLELSEIKKPSSTQLPQFWEENRESMLAYLEAVHIGARGLVTDRLTGAPLWAEVRVEGNAQPVFTDPDVGDYHRLLLPGEYRLQVRAPGYIPFEVEGVAVTEGPATRVDVGLSTGDLDGDGAVNAVDIQSVLESILSADPSGADVDGGGVTVTDLQTVVNLALRRPGPE